MKGSCQAAKCHKILIGLVTLLIFAISGGCLFAAHPLITDDAGTVGEGAFQAELNGEHERDGTYTATEISTTVTGGLRDGVDVVLSVPYQFFRFRDDEGQRTRERGIGDVALDLKWRVYEKDGFSFAVKPGLTLPTGDEKKGFGAGKATYGIYLIATKEMGSWAIHANLGYTRNENKIDERVNLWQASLASEVEITKTLRVVANVGVERNGDRLSDRHPAFALAGLIYSVSEKLDIDLGVKAGLNRSEADHAILGGVSWRF